MKRNVVMESLLFGQYDLEQIVFYIAIKREKTPAS